MDASFEEKSVWVQLVSLVAGLGTYFIVAGSMLLNGIYALPAYVPLFVGTVVLIVAINVGGHIVAALTGRPEPPDERDRLIGWKAESRASWILGAGVVIGITGLVLSVSEVWVAHGLLLALFVSEVVKNAVQLVLYRRGF